MAVCTASFSRHNSYVPIFTRSNDYSLLGGNMEHSSSYSFMAEKRQLFLRSYQFCRKKSVAQKIKTCLIRWKKAMRLRFRSVGKLRRLVWPRLQYALYYLRKRRFLRLINYHQYSYYFN